MMRTTRFRFATGALLGSLVFLAACSGPQLKVEPIPVTANPTDEANKLETELAAARQQQMNVLSPTWFGKAEASLAQAKKLISQKGAMGEIGENVSQGRAELLKAQEMAKISHTAIPEAIKGRKLARVAGATAFRKDYPIVEEKFLDLTRAIEDNNLSYAQRNQQEVVDAFRVIEIRAIKETTLGEVRELLAQAEKEGAKKLAPAILADAQKELREVDAFISANPYAKEEMHQKANAALFQAKRLVQLTRRSEEFRTMQPIKVSLWAEDVLQRVTAELGATDMRDHPFDTQVENVLGIAGALKTDQEVVSTKVRGLQAEIDTLKTQHPGEIEALRKQQMEQTDTLRKQHTSEVTALKNMYEEKVDSLVKQVAALEGKSKEEQARLAEVLAAQRAERERTEAAQRVEKERAAAERRATEAKLAAEKRAAEESLAAERKFNQQYSQVQGLFAKEEAETYKQGQQMVIRLRGMSFPIGQSVIMPENYALLSKVQQAIRTFDSPDLTIEGHTDSTGALEMNNHLSQQRAEAVQEYLLANGVAIAEKVAAVGYGPSRPLAPNTSVEGRAQNRRIDVIITPSKGLATR